MKKGVKEEGIFRNYGVFGYIYNQLYIFYFTNDDLNTIKYKKIKNKKMINEIQYQKYYIIETIDNIILYNIICNRRVYTSSQNMNILINLATNIIKNSGSNYLMVSL
jgi:hypothetical protein